MTSDRRDGDMIDGRRYSVAQLRAAVFKGGGKLARPLALALLGRKNYAQKLADLRKLMLNEKETPRLRNMAAQFLGQMGTSAALKALERGLAVKDELTLRGVLHGLGLAGSDKTRQALQPLKRRQGIVGRTAERTDRRLGYRTATSAAPDRAATPPALLQLGRGATLPIEVKPARGRPVSDALGALSKAGKIAELVADGAVSLRCGDRDMLFLFTRAAGGPTLPAQQTVLGVVAARERLEGEEWRVNYILVADPEEDRSRRLQVTTARGTPVFAGAARLSRGGATFELRAVDRPGAVAVDIKGTYEKGRLTFTQAKSGQRRRPSLAPTALPRPA